MKYFILLFSMAFCSVSVLNNMAVAADSNPPLNRQDFHVIGRGTVTMPGSIIDTACAIATDSANQDITLKLSSDYELKTKHFSHDEDLLIKLVDCTTKRDDGSIEWKDISVTFLGHVTHADPSLFAMVGDIEGVGIQVRDNDLNVMTPGKRYKVDSSLTSSLTLHYKVRLEALSDNIKNGISSSTIKIRLDYD